MCVTRGSQYGQWVRPHSVNGTDYPRRHAWPIPSTVRSCTHRISILPTFKGVWYAVMNFALLLLSDLYSAYYRKGWCGRVR